MLRFGFRKYGMESKPAWWAGYCWGVRDEPRALFCPVGLNLVLRVGRAVLLFLHRPGKFLDAPFYAQQMFTRNRAMSNQIEQLRQDNAELRASLAKIEGAHTAVAEAERRAEDKRLNNRVDDLRPNRGKARKKRRL